MTKYDLQIVNINEFYGMIKLLEKTNELSLTENTFSISNIHHMFRYIDNVFLDTYKINIIPSYSFILNDFKCRFVIFNPSDSAIEFYEKLVKYKQLYVFNVINNISKEICNTNYPIYIKDLLDTFELVLDELFLNHLLTYAKEKYSSKKVKKIFKVYSSKLESYPFYKPSVKEFLNYLNKDHEIYYVHSDENINELKNAIKTYNIDKHITGIIMPEYMNNNMSTELYDLYDGKKILTGVCSDYLKNNKLYRVI